MGKKSRKKPPPLTLEQQLAVMPPRPELDPVEPWMDAAGAAAQIAWDRQRQALLDQIRKRDADTVRLVDPGRDASGNFMPSPYTARGHVIRPAPKKLGIEIPKDSSFPKRIETQRMIDRYRIRSQITPGQFRAAEFLLSVWQAAGLEAKMTAGYDPVGIPGSSTTDTLIEKRVDGTMAWLVLMEVVPYRSRGVVRAVVIEDRSAGDWARQRGIRRDDSGRVGMGRLRAGLSALVDHLKY
ncbi:MAG: hypothetical protein FD144_4783 [Rhodospirillaceae bacterium]|nr:MAG: hypothetical protein FD144_4783 [Rhodospirillaceae bacterium]